MKKLKQIISQIQSSDSHSSEEFMSLLWQYICYSPKMPTRLQQQQLLDKSERLTLKVRDEYFSKSEISFNILNGAQEGTRCCLLMDGGPKL